jgi:hypothetical protein
MFNREKIRYKSELRLEKDMGMGSIACRICGKRAQSVFIGKVRGHIRVTYYACDSCGFLETEEPYWLDAAYEDPVDPADTGIFQRNLVFRNITAVLLFFLFNPHGRFLDFAGGFGVLSRLMRDIGFDFTWHDKYAKNLFCRGFEYDIGVSLPIELITCFETFEHFADPLAVMTTMTSISRNILFTSHLLPAPLPELNTCWHYQLQTGRRVLFCHQCTLE